MEPQQIFCCPVDTANTTPRAPLHLEDTFGIIAPHEHGESDDAEDEQYSE
jgi:hypothetical protein